MPNLTLEAHFDGRSILLDEPYQIPPNARLLVTLVDPGQDGCTSKPRRPRSAGD